MNNNKLDTITNLFEGKEIRSIWNSEKEDYFFSVVDVISALTDSKIPKRYWSDLKRKLTVEGSQLYENIVQLKMLANDGKKRKTDVLDTKGILRLIESGEIATRDIAQSEHPQGFNENMNVAKRGGQVANDARKSYEKQTKKSAIFKLIYHIFIFIV